MSRVHSVHCALSLVHAAQSGAADLLVAVAFSTCLWCTKLEPRHKSYDEGRKWAMAYRFSELGLPSRKLYSYSYSYNLLVRKTVIVLSLQLVFTLTLVRVSYTRKLCELLVNLITHVLTPSALFAAGRTATGGTRGTWRRSRRATSRPTTSLSTTAKSNRRSTPHLHVHVHVCALSPASVQTFCCSAHVQCLRRAAPRTGTRNYRAHAEIIYSQLNLVAAIAPMFALTDLS